jgi:peptidoglycan hydrolase-like protein with peptidoglycan-binding domain
MSDPDLQKAQERLKWRYYLAEGEDDGVWTSKTHKAVIQYQMDRSADEFYAFNVPLPIDGVLNGQTKKRLIPGVLEKGGSHNDVNLVRLVQNILKSMGPPYDPGAVDGDFRDKTETAVKEVQKKFFDFDGKPLVVDGRVAQRTWAAIWG